MLEAANCPLIKSSKLVAGFSNYRLYPMLEAEWWLCATYTKYG